MKNQKEEEENRAYFERNIPFVILIVGAGLYLDWLSIYLLLDVNPWGTATAIPGLMLTLQGISLILNPYATVYSNRFEIKQSYLYSKEIFFLDTKAIDTNKKNSIGIIYNDNDVESISLSGMRSSHKEKFKKEISKRISESLKNRDF